MQKAWAWLKKWGTALFGAIAAVLLLVLGGGWLWRRREQALGAVRDELAVEKAKGEIARLRGVREEVAREVGEKDEAIVEVDRQLAENRRKIVEAHEGGQSLSDEEVDALFARMGF